MLIFSLQEDKHDEIGRDVQQILSDYSNRFYVSSVAVRELIHAYKLGNIKIKSVKILFEAMEELGIDIIPMNKHHLLKYAELEPVSGHKDPNDHIIIAQAMADKIPIISSDRKFKEYVGQGLNFVFNQR
jgi:PIN domain nuclease of toxin-antitoxin system